jgi:hypothetical protein
MKRIGYLDNCILVWDAAQSSGLRSFGRRVKAEARQAEMFGVEGDQGKLMMDGCGGDKHVGDIHRLPSLSQEVDEISGSIGDSIVNG